MFKALLAAFLGLAALVSVSYAGWVNGYTRSNGTQVSGYYRSDANSTVTDNYSYKGNVNPYTGETGTRYYRENPTSEYYGTSSKRKSSSSYYGW